MNRTCPQCGMQTLVWRNNQDYDVFLACFKCAFECRSEELNDHYADDDTKDISNADS
jgi:Zn ribbon nucleic-acid-binding protein